MPMPKSGGPWTRKKRIKTQIIEEHRNVEHISFNCPPALREKLVAIAYLRGHNGSYAAPARQLMARAINEYIANDMTKEEREEYEQILGNVQSALYVSRMKRQEREAHQKMVEAAMEIEREDEMPVIPDLPELEEE